MGKNKKMVGQVKMYTSLAVAVVLVLIIGTALMYAFNFKAGILMSLISAICIIAAIIIYFYYKPRIFEQFVDFATTYGQVQKKLLKEHMIAYCLLDNNARIIWMNNAFSIATEKDCNYKKTISGIFPSITKEMLNKEVDEHLLMVEFGEKIFRVNIKKIYFQDFAELDIIDEQDSFSGYLFAVYLYDETELNKFIIKNKEQQLVTGLIYIDNYDEALETVETVKRSMLSALIDRRINKYMDNVDGITKKLEKDKYFIAFRHKFLEKLQQDKFSILEDVKSINLGNEMDVTLSIGIGVNEESYSLSCEHARMAIDLALGRGGDQAVVKEHDLISYYGGKTKQVDKNTRVKARVKAHALREIMESRDKIVVMGHSIGDVDSFGAAIGIYRAAATLGKKVSIIIDEITTSVRPLIDCFIESDKYPEDMFMNSTEAIGFVDNQTAVIVVDVNKPSYTECPEVLEKTRTIVVLDHHRQSSETIENAVLSYVEPYASSACEMVAEILQYFTEGIKLQGSEADCIYAGIMIDTNNFMSKTGVRTFEAAAYLRRCGADVTRVRKMFRNDMQTYKARAEAVRHAEVFKGFAISLCPSEGIESPTIVGAQAANELLNIIGVRASIILTQYNDKIYISSRSIDEINVQVIMEKLGGGGHANIAGAQLEGYSINQAKELIKKTINAMMEEGDI